MEKQKSELDIGLKETDRRANADVLSLLLADTYILYVKTQNFHWNVVGPNFASLHLLFEAQYQELAIANDLIAESIRALGFRVVATTAEFSKNSSIKETQTPMSAKEMILELIDGQESVIHTARKLFHKVDGLKDIASADLVTQRIRQHEKAAWMLRSLLSE